MTKDQTKAAAQVMLAWAEWKTVQYRRGSVWSDLYEDAGWDWCASEYRIKPEPREWWMRQHGNGVPCTSCGLFNSYADAAKPAADQQGTTTIVKIRVLE